MPSLSHRWESLPFPREMNIGPCPKGFPRLCGVLLASALPLSKRSTYTHSTRSHVVHTYLALAIIGNIVAPFLYLRLSLVLTRMAHFRQRNSTWQKLTRTSFEVILSPIFGVLPSLCVTTTVNLCRFAHTARRRRRNVLLRTDGRRIRQLE
ncbi:uncharacterized protein EDB93DRAFT_153360 [Suillus bovinus]|uniref:uncharacterized protein n=1 Tax=Suillus bovinus TaxID=48563 RepID=UPI001B881A59|nr:uncharacterized protein EDB93DRAFT_153360 [Suillus bovinus]KAG2154337.1 hypothetical protein EDB93DRAFT_153360 [Suillus bovinus]